MIMQFLCSHESKFFVKNICHRSGIDKLLGESEHLMFSMVE